MARAGHRAAQAAQRLMAAQTASFSPSSSRPTRRKKKRKKKKAPKTSSSRCSGVQPRRCGQWLRFRSSVSPWCSPLALGIMTSMDQKDSIHCACRRLRQWHMQGWFAGIAPRAVFFPVVVRPRMLGIMAGMNQRDSYVARLSSLVVSQRLIPMVLSTMVIPQLQFLDKLIDGPVVLVVEVSPSRSHARCVQRQVLWLRSAVAAHQEGRLLPCRGAEFDPHGFSEQQSTEIPLLPYTWWSTSLLRWSCEFHSCRVENLAGCRRHPGRGAESVSHGLADHRNFFEFHFDKVIDVPVMQVVRAPQVRRGGDGRAPTVALVEKLVAGCSSTS